MLLILKADFLIQNSSTVHPIYLAMKVYSKSIATFFPRKSTPNDNQHSGSGSEFVFSIRIPDPRQKRVHKVL